MKSSLEKLSTLERKLNIVVPAEEVQAAFTKAFKGIQKHATVKGFRKGKAPLPKIKSIFGDRVKQDVIQDIVQTHYATALDEHSLEPISFPEIEFDHINEDKEFNFSAEFEVRPEVKLAQFEHLPVKKEKLELRPDFVESTIEDIRRSRAEETAVLEDRPAQMGDIAIIDFEGTLDSGPLENGSAKDFSIELGSNTFIPGFEEGIAGLKIGETKDLNLSFPEPYHAADLADKPVTFKVTLKSLKKKTLPELTDEFVKTLGGPYETVNELKNAIQDDYEKRETRRIQDDLKNRVIRVLVEHNPVEVPKTLLNEQKKALVADLKERMSQQGLGDQQFEEYKEKWDEDFTKTASQMIQSSFLVDTIARENKLFAGPEDIDAKIQEYAKQTGIDAERVREFYNERERQSRLAFQITEEKVVEFLLSKADLKEVSKEELASEEHKDA